MPVDMARGMINALRNCDYEAMGELSADIGLTLYGGAELGVGLVDVVGVRGVGLGITEDIPFRSPKWWEDNGMTVHLPDDPTLPGAQFKTNIQAQPSRYSCASTCISMGDEGFGRPSNVEHLHQYAELVNDIKGKGIRIEKIEELLIQRGYNTGAGDEWTKNALPNMQHKLQEGYGVIADAGAPPGHAVLLRSIGFDGTNWSVSFYDPWTERIILSDRSGWSAVTGGSTRYIYFKP